jgi:hypothetical protein
MKKVLIQKGKGHSEFRSEKPHQTIPVIVDKIIDEETGKDLYYVCENGKLYVPEIYDRLYRVEHGLKMKPKGYKGSNPDKKRVIV